MNSVPERERVLHGPSGLGHHRVDRSHPSVEMGGLLVLGLVFRCSVRLDQEKAEDAYSNGGGWARRRRQPASSQALVFAMPHASLQEDLPDVSAFVDG